MNTGGTAEQPGTVVEQWKTTQNTPEYQRNTNVTPVEHPEQQKHAKRRTV